MFLSSQLSVDLKTDKILSGTIAEQTRQALENIKFLLESSGASMDDILKVVVYMRDIKDFDQMNRIYRKYLLEGQEPARVTIHFMKRFIYHIFITFGAKREFQTILPLFQIHFIISPTK